MWCHRVRDKSAKAAPTPQPGSFLGRVLNVSALGGLDGTSTPATPRLPCVEGSWPPPGAVTTDKTHTQSHCPGQQGRPPESRACDQVGRSLSHVTRVEWRPLGQHGKHTPRTLGHVLQDRHHAACDKKWERKLAQCLRDYRVTAAENVMYGARRGDRSGTHFERARPIKCSARPSPVRTSSSAAFRNEQPLPSFWS